MEQGSLWMFIKKCPFGFNGNHLEVRVDRIALSGEQGKGEGEERGPYFKRLEEKEDEKPSLQLLQLPRTMLILKILQERNRNASGYIGGKALF